MVTARGAACGVLVVVLYVVAVSAATKNVQCCNLATLRLNVSTAVNGDIIQLGAGTYTGCPMFSSIPSQSFTITGQGLSTVIDCGGVGYAFRALGTTNAAKLMMRQLVIRNAVITSAPVAQYTGSGDLTLQDLTFTGNTATSSGVVSLSVPSVTITRGMFSNNWAKNVSVADATSTGGALALLSGTLVLNSTVFSGNTASYGGAISVACGNVYAYNTSFISNTGEYGGAVAVIGPSVTMNCTRCVFTNNLAFASGAGIYASAPGAPFTLDLQLTTFSLNRVPLESYGGGIRLSVGALWFLVNGCRFVNNVQSAIRMDSVSTFQVFAISNTLFDGNQIASGGGSSIWVGYVATYAYSVAITNNTFSNGLQADGGVIVFACFVPFAAPMVIRNNTFSGNVDVADCPNYSLLMLRTTYVNLPPITLLDNTFASNYANYDHGMLISMSSSLVIMNTTFRNNSAYYNNNQLMIASGFLIYSPAGNLTIDNCLFSSNTITVYGYTFNIGSLRITNTVFDSNIAHMGVDGNILATGVSNLYVQFKNLVFRYNVGYILIGLCNAVTDIQSVVSTGDRMLNGFQSIQPVDISNTTFQDGWFTNDVMDVNCGGALQQITINRNHFGYEALSLVVFGNTTVSGLTMQDNTGSGYLVFVDAFSNASITFRNALISNNSIDSCSLIEICADSGNIVITNTSVVDCRAPTVIKIDTLIGPYSVLPTTTLISGSTFARNSVTAPLALFGAHDGGSFSWSYNVIAQNSVPQGVVTSNMPIQMIGSTLQSNMAPGVYLFASTLVTIDSSHFANNSVGVLRTDTSFGPEVIVVTRSIFSSNTGRALTGLAVTCVQCTFVNNSASFGPAILAVSAAINSSTFTANRAQTNGGAIYAQTIVASNATFLANTAGGTGGAVYATVSVMMASGQCRSNTASVNGGGIGAPSFGPSVPVVINGGSFIGNQALSGGAIGSAIIVASLNAVSLFGNIALATGGAVYEQGGGTSQIVSSAFTKNSAAQGGAVYSQDTAILWNTTFVGNSATFTGGAIFGSSEVRLAQCNFTGNFAFSAGGGVYSIAKMSFNSSTFSNNSAGQGGMAFGSGLVSRGNSYLGNSAKYGAGVCVSTAAASVFNDSFVDNVAFGGAAIYASSVPLSITSSSFLYNTGTADKGGAIYSDRALVTFGGATVVRNNNIMNMNASTGAGFYCNGGTLTGVSSGMFSSNCAGSNCPDTVTEADCTACGCCPTPDSVHFPHTCVLQAGVPCNYTCNPGYARVFTSLTCQNSSLPATVCAPVLCSPFTLPNVAVTFTGNSQTGDLANMHCCYGYAPWPGQNATVAQCLGPNWRNFDTGELFGLDCDPHNVSSNCGFRCTTKQCSPVAAPDFSSVTCYDGSVEIPCNLAFSGNTMNMTCNQGYKPSGASTSTCYGNNQCNGWCPLGTCDPLSCLVPPQPGRIVAPAPLTNTNCTVTCDASAGYVAVGDAKQQCVYCGYNLQFDQPLLNCTPITCPLPPAIGNGTVVAINNVTIKYSCDSHFKLDHPAWATQTCVTDGETTKWNFDPPKCCPVTCTFSVDKTSSISPDSCPSIMHEGENCTITCLNGTAGAPVHLGCSQGQIVPSLDSISGACTRCPATSYAIAGSSICTACVNGQAMVPLASAASDCGCYEGYYENTPGEGDCVACPAGGYCAGGKTRPVNDDGYYPTDDPLVFIKCLTSGACLRNNSCAAGYELYLCGVCQPHFYKLNGVCTACPSNSGARIILFIVLGLVACTLLVVIAEPSPIAERSYGLNSISIAVNFFQIVATFLATKLSWGSNTHSFFGGMSAININFEMASPECVIEYTFYDKMQATLIAPIVVLGLMFVVALVLLLKNWIQQKRPGWVTFRVTAYSVVKSCAAGFFLFMTLAYLTLTTASFAIFVCDTHSDGKTIINSSPGDECHTAVWSRNAVLAVFGIIFYVVGTPAVVLGVYANQRRRFGAGSAGEDILSNFFVGKYQEHAWYWETLVMARKFGIVMIALYAGDTPIVQAICCVFIFFAATLLSLLIRPFRWFWHNVAEDGSLLACLVILFCGIAATSNLLSNTQNIVADVFSVLVVVVMIVLLVVVLAMELYVFINVALLLKKQGAQNKTLSHVHHGKVLSIIPNPGMLGGVLTAGEDGRVRSIQTGGDGFAIDTAVDLTVEGVRFLVAVPRTQMIIVGANETVQVWSVASSPPTCIHTEKLEHIVTCAVIDDQHMLCVGTQGGRVSIYRFHNTRRDAPAESDVTVFRARVNTKTAFKKFLTSDSRAAKADTALPSMALDSMGSLGASSLLLGQNSMAATSLNGGGVFGSLEGPPSLLATDAPHREPPAPPSLTEGMEMDTLIPPTDVQNAFSKTPAQASLILGHCYGNMHVGAVVAVATGTRFFYSASDRVVRRWSPKRESHLREWEVVSAATGSAGRSITALEVMGSHVFCATAGAIIYDIDTQASSIRVISGHSSRVTCLAATSGRLYSGADDGQARVWNPMEGTDLQKLPHSNVGVSALCVTNGAVTWGLQNGSLKYTRLNSALDRDDPVKYLEPVYRRCPCLRPRTYTSKKKLSAGEEAARNTEQVSLLMEEISLDQMPEFEAGHVFVALEESMARFDDKARRI